MYWRNRGINVNIPFFFIIIIILRKVNFNHKGNNFDENELKVYSKKEENNWK